MGTSLKGLLILLLLLFYIMYEVRHKKGKVSTRTIKHLFLLLCIFNLKCNQIFFKFFALNLMSNIVH